ncbi:MULTISPECIES: CtsR family transcriptional regulator [Aerococcus]|uniref:Transcriptional regulator CtsR n=1 Tax=Aerococcus sanguinicola TaxID=119206 RepID=A0A5N1GJM3_9LACT|nr:MULTISPECIES: CtsR family transcriptional regulator [Aerococcus]KAA9300221.1 CtsR family transcriptional regulator [Aerococcus sanguinicola]MDK6369567.1 CtsR family transcriptional regulator [Aerococcus sp. UMB9870]MDK6680055.1 CtsR family transcriptional regulator [Aerococcus sp. UMB8608]MDK6686064.1 CtsR family transcriptional regulator [Aerococcus sp. UMB8623]MDK6939844.1 CtsR family transcriptional regulator [Aerococcus sp. UMB8487]
MRNKNMSDIIEAYLKQVLQESSNVEIRRSEIAERFECVPSQINYVINTRFTPQNGYHVESKRGGGGYIRIVKMTVVDEADYIDSMIQLIGDDLSDKDARAIISNLHKNDLLTETEARLIYAALDKEVMAHVSQADSLRALILTNVLRKLKYEH